MKNYNYFDEHHTLERLRHYLPSQNPLKDFVHHNTLHAFQDKPFYDALNEASQIFGYKVYLQLSEYRKLFKEGKIFEPILRKVISHRKGRNNVSFWLDKLLNTSYSIDLKPRIGKLRNQWKKIFNKNWDKTIHPILFATISSYLDQGISQQHFPDNISCFIESIQYVQKNSLIPIFKSKRVQEILNRLENIHLESLLEIIVGEKKWFEKYLFDQQFNHPGWSGMVSILEQNPQFLLDKRNITLKGFILFELLLELDYLDNHWGTTKWKPLCSYLPSDFEYDLFENIQYQEVYDVLSLWQEAFEFSYYEQVLNGIVKTYDWQVEQKNVQFQAIFCIDDRSCSIRRYIEKLAPEFDTYGTAGFFNVEFYFLPHGAKFYTKSCPAPVQPKYIIKECAPTKHHQYDLHLKKNTLGLLGGAITSSTIGVFTAWNLIKSIFFPSETPICISSSKYMDGNVALSIENIDPNDKIDGLQVGFTVEEMTQRMLGLLKSIGLEKNFGKIVYIIGHGASSVNNSYYAGYDCGACSGRPGSVNARVAAFMLNHPKVRQKLKEYQIIIPETTQFLAGLHDTTKDTFEFYDENLLNYENYRLHLKNLDLFEQALDLNAFERSRRFDAMNHEGHIEIIHERVKKRAWSLFEPRPEYNHATNAICIVGKRAFVEHLFLDRRAFLNSYNYELDPEGTYLEKILLAVTPVCGGINLEYYFSRMDRHKLGAGSKLPHNVMGLIGVANGMYGDLRTGLPYQMVEIHDPLRLGMIVEHFPSVVLNIIEKNSSLKEWYIHQWIHLMVFHPKERKFYRYENHEFHEYTLTPIEIKPLENAEYLFRNYTDHLPVFYCK